MCYINMSYTFISTWKFDENTRAYDIDFGDIRNFGVDRSVVGLLIFRTIGHDIIIIIIIIIIMFGLCLYIIITRIGPKGSFTLARARVCPSQHVSVVPPSDRRRSRLSRTMTTPEIRIILFVASVSSCNTVHVYWAYLVFGGAFIDDEIREIFIRLKSPLEKLSKILDMGPKIIVYRRRIGSVLIHVYKIVCVMHDGPKRLPAGAM